MLNKFSRLASTDNFDNVRIFSSVRTPIRHRQVNLTMSLKDFEASHPSLALMSADASLQGTIEPCAEEDNGGIT